MPARRKPVALKKLEGTYRKDRDADRADFTIAQTDLILSDTARVNVPASLKHPEAKKYFKDIVDGLSCIGVLAKIDLKQVEEFCLVFQKLKSLEKKFITIEPEDKDFYSVMRAYLSLLDKFNSMAALYYVSPVARSKIRLDELAIKEKELNVEAKTKDAVSNLLSARVKNG